MKNFEAMKSSLSGMKKGSGKVITKLPKVPKQPYAK